MKAIAAECRKALTTMAMMIPTRPMIRKLPMPVRSRLVV